MEIHANVVTVLDSSVLFCLPNLPATSCGVSALCVMYVQAFEHTTHAHSF